MVVAGARVSNELRSTGRRCPYGVVRLAADDSRVLEKRVCYSLRNAELQGRVWKRKHPTDVVRLIPLGPTAWKGDVVTL